MFQVKNKEVLNRISDRTLRANRLRNLFVILAVALTTVLIGTIFSIGMSYLASLELQKVRLMGTTAHAMLSHPRPEQLEKLKSLDYVKSMGEQYHVATVVNTSEMKKMLLSLFRFEEEEWEKHRKGAITGFVGHLPEKYNEIMMPLWVLNNMGIDEPRIGMEIPIRYQLRTLGGAIELDQEQVFVLSAYYKDYLNIRSGNINSIFVSDAFAKESGRNITEHGSVTVTFKSKNVLALIERLEKDLSPAEGQQIRPVPIYAVQSNSDQATLIGFAFLIFIILFSGYLLIYNVLYISVSKDIRFYGLLKAIGTTPKQLKRIVIRQALRLSAVGIPIGLLLSVLFSFQLVPMALSTVSLQTEVEISFHPFIFIGATFFALLTTWISSVKPAGITGKISPVEAVRYIGSSLNQKKISKGSSGAKLHKMALANLFRDKKRSLVVFASLIMGISIFLIINTLLISMDIDNLVVSYMDSDFYFRNESFGVMNTNEYMDQKFDDNFLAKIRDTEGVSRVTETYMQSFCLQYDSVYDASIEAFCKKYKIDQPTKEQLENNNILFGYLVALDPWFLENLNKTLEDPIDVEAFQRGDFVLVGTRYPELFPEEFTIEGELTEGEAFKLKAGGFVEEAFLVSKGGAFTPNLYISKEVFLELVDEPIVYSVNVDAEKSQWPLVLDTLKSMISGDNDIFMESRLENLESLKSAKLMMYILGGGLSGVLALIGILNFVNVMVTSVTVRSIELAMLESIGMAKKQIKSMLVMEGLWYFVISASIVCTLGNAAAYGIFTLFRQQADYAIYAFPLIPLILSLFLVLLVCIITPLMIFRFHEKATVVERLRKAE